MAIYDPSPFLTPTDLRLLKLLSCLILQVEGVDNLANRSHDEIDLTHHEAEELLDLLEAYIETKRFQETSYLVESLFSGGNFDSKSLREIYLYWRRFHGKSRALATDQWEVFLSRLGVAPRHYGGTPWYRTDSKPMSFEHFIKMERKLANATGLSPRVQQLLLSYVRSQSGYLDLVRAEKTQLKTGVIAEKPKAIVASLKRGQGSKVGAAPLSKDKIVATMTIVMDLSAAYTTRDWSVASLLSTIAGAAPAAILD